MAKTTAGLALLVMSLVMAGCGSSDSTSEDTGFAFYRGSERPAVLSRDNAGVMLANVLKANRSVIADFGTFPVDPAIALPASDDDEADDPMSMLLRHTRRQGEGVMQRVRRAAPPIEISEVQAMSCETGSVEISVVVNANGTGSASLTYYDCENLGYVYSGEAFISVLAYDQTLDFPSRMRFDFRSLRYRDANSSWRIDGSIESVRELGQHVDTLLIPEVTVQNESSGWMYMAKDFRARVRYNALLYDVGRVEHFDSHPAVTAEFEHTGNTQRSGHALESHGYGRGKVDVTQR